MITKRKVFTKTFHPSEMYVVMGFDVTGNPKTVLVKEEDVFCVHDVAYVQNLEKHLLHMLEMSSKWGKEWFDKETWNKVEQARKFIKI